MARKKKAEEHENLDRWLVSYADFITLLFAFFVVMYALSTINEGKYRVLSDALTNAFKNVTQIPETGPIPSSSPQGQPVPMQNAAKKTQFQRKHQEKMRNMAKDILNVLAPLERKGQVKVTQSNRGITVEINASVLFNPGQALLHRDSVKALQAVARVLAPESYAVQVEGYTDNIPISTSTFPSNWELSAARASSVVRLFIDNGVDGNRLTAIGYSENRPVESNSTAEGRARNRRVKVMILAETPDQVKDIPIAAQTPAPQEAVKP